jgi:patatin-like phospholipase/acyl hydrolase
MDASAQESVVLPCRILSLDGGGAKGFYTIGVLKEIEAAIKKPLCEHFDLIFGTSTGAIIAALLVLGKQMEEIHAIYKEHVPAIMSHSTKNGRSDALSAVAKSVFGETSFTEAKTGVGIVATNWLLEKPMIFKSRLGQAHGRTGSFVPGFGCTIADAVRASCSAFPYFNRVVLTTAQGENVELFDGGYCANSPTLYAIADGISAMKKSHQDLRVLSIGVGMYPQPKSWLSPKYMYEQCCPVKS